MKPDPQSPESIGRMAQNYEEMHRRDTLDQLAATLVRVGLLAIGALGAIGVFLLIQSIFGGR